MLNCQQGDTILLAGIKMVKALKVLQETNWQESKTKDESFMRIEMENLYTQTLTGNYMGEF